jgi:hypothetical protein
MIPRSTRVLNPKKRKPKSNVTEFTVNEDDEEGNDDEDDMDIEIDEGAVLSLEDEDEFTELDTTTRAIATSDVKDVDVPLVVSPTLSSLSTTTTTTSSSSRSKVTKVRVQYGAFEPGTVVQIEVGDTSRARKAWKKRRRSDSPLLVPCSILHVNRIATIRWNCIYLLEKFGSPNPNQHYATATANKGIRISLTELSVRYRTHLKTSLLQQATVLGYNNSYDFMNGLFPKSVQDAYGVQITYEERDIVEQNGALKQEQAQLQLYLETPLSRTRAHSRAASAAILQFTKHDTNDVDTLDHTGLVRIKKMKSNVEPIVERTDDEMRAVEIAARTSNNNNLYSLVPLSVALRVSSEDVLDNLVSNGSRHAAVVFDYDVQGDAGVAPLMTLSLNPQRNQVRDRFKQKNKLTTTTTKLRRKSLKGGVDTDMHWFHELKLGDGPYTGKVVRLIKGGAIVDCNVYRHKQTQTKHQQQLQLQKTTVGTATKSSSAEVLDDATLTRNENENVDDTASFGKDCIPVFGVLRFKDAVLSDKFVSDNAATMPTLDDELIADDDEDEDEDWSTVFSIDELNNFDDVDDSDIDENNEDDDDDDEDEDDNSETDLDDVGEILAAFNLENDDEFAEGEDITHLFNIKDDGTLEYTDPATGVTQIISDVNIQDEHDHDDDDDEEYLDETDDEDDDDDEEYLDETDDEDNDDVQAALDDDDNEEEGEEEYDFDNNDDDDKPTLLIPLLTMDGKQRKLSATTASRQYRTQTLRVGDTITVYMKSISKQSNQLFLSMDVSLQGKNAKTIKKETDVTHKLHRLLKQLGGYQRLQEINGLVCTGIIQATSNSGGEWYYVQPTDLDNVPMGIAFTTTTATTTRDSDRSSNNHNDGDDDTNYDTNKPQFQLGDIVRIQINGIDQDRGQLAMTILQKVTTNTI